MDEIVAAKLHVNREVDIPIGTDENASCRD